MKRLEFLIKLREALIESEVIIIDEEYWFRYKDKNWRGLCYLIPLILPYVYSERLSERLLLSVFFRSTKPFRSKHGDYWFTIENPYDMKADRIEFLDKKIRWQKFLKFLHLDFK